MIDTISKIAFDIHSSKGVFALLLGSGVSYSAKIPTGWAITLDLVRQVAALHGEKCEPDPEKWYREKFGVSPDYSDLLDKLGSTRDLRQEIIRKYIEPTEAERQRGEKQPTSAHHAIANLMAKGYIRVVLTTNFDKLLEQALADLSLHPTVISSADHIHGARPLAHADMTIIKLHGDYLDTRILNTSGELSSYDPRVDDFLDRIFDDYGLICCGWSAEWDTALKAAIDRTPARRYPFYFTYTSKPSTSAIALTERRGGLNVKIPGADKFFEMLEYKIQAIDTLKISEPKSVALAVATLKQFIPEERHQIRLHDFVNEEVERTRRHLESPEFYHLLKESENFEKRVLAYDAALEILIAMAYTAGKWCQPSQAKQWATIIRDFGEMGAFNGNDLLANLRAYPGTALMYSFLLGAVYARRPTNFAIVAGEALDVSGRRIAAIHLNLALYPVSIRTEFANLPDVTNPESFGSEHLANVIKPHTEIDIRSEKQFDLMFAQVELAIAFAYSAITGPQITWLPLGRKNYDYSLNDSIVSRWRKDYETLGKKSELYIMAALSEPPDFSKFTKILQNQ